MRALARGRVAAVSLIAASVGSAALEAASLDGDAAPSVWLELVTTLAWLPAVQGIEHFLKRGSELWSLVLSGLATVGVVGRTIEIATETAAVPSETGQRLHEIAGSTTDLLPLAVGLMGIGLWRCRRAPAWVSILLASGGALGLIGAHVGGHALELVASSTLALPCAWIAQRVLTNPGTWGNAEL
jgi:hypothetical protein